MRKRIVEFGRMYHQRIPFFIMVAAAYAVIVLMMFWGMQLIRSRAHSIIAENYLTQRQYALEESLNAFQQQIENFRSVETAMDSLEEYRTGKLTKQGDIAPRHYFTFNKIRKNFSKHCTELLLSNDCFIYFRTSGALVMSNRFTFDADSYFSSVSISGQPSDQTLGTVHSFPNPQHQLFPVTVEENGIQQQKLLYLYHWQSRSVVYGMFLNENTLLTLFNLQDQPQGTRLRMLLTAPEEQLLYDSGAETSDPSETLQGTLDSLPLCVQLTIPSQYFSSLTQPISNLFSSYIIGTLIAALLLSLTFSIGLTRPLRRLLHILPDQSDGPDGRVKNELYLLDQGIRTAHAENEQMRTEIARSRKTLQQNILSRLVVQESLSRMDRQQMAEYLSDLTGSIRLLCLRLMDEQGREMSPGDAYLFQQLLTGTDFGRCHTLQMSSDLFVLLLDDSADFEERVSGALSRLVGQLSHSGLSLEAGASGPVTPEQLHEGYLHAQYAMRYYTPPVSVFEPNAVSQPMRYADLGAFRNAVLGCDEAEAQRLLDLFRQLRGQYHWLDGTLSYILDTVVSEMNLVLPPPAGGLGAYTSGVIRALQVQKEQYASTLIQSIVEYIHERFSDSSLSVESIAEHFSISKSYLYQLFRSSGTTPGEKLEQIRMQHAHRLLVSTRMSVMDVASACGYNSSNTFHKVYKKYHGCTPGTSRAREEGSNENH